MQRFRPRSGPDDGHPAGQNIVRLRSAYAGFSQGDVAKLLKAMHHEVRWDATLALLHTGTFTGHDGVLEYFRRFADYWDDFLLEPESFAELGPEEAVVTGTIVGHEKATGHLIRASFTHHVHFREGLVSGLRVVVHSEEPGLAHQMA